MFILGTKTAHLKTEPSHELQCENCNTTGKIVISILSNYVHVLQFPVMPFGTTGIAQCIACKKTVQGDALKQKYSEQYNQIAKGTKPLIWQFSGLVLITTFLALSFINLKKA